MTTIWTIDRPDRYEIGKLLSRLPEERREQWLKWCCTQAKSKLPVDCIGPYPPDQVYLCWCNLCSQYGVDMESTRIALEQLVRKYGIALSVFAGGEILVSS